MDFQTQQEQAKQSTFRLIVLLALGVIAIMAVVSLLMLGVFYYGTGSFEPITALAVAAPLTTIGVVGSSLVKTAQIKGGGGSYVAASMGGRPIDFNTMDPAEKRLSNIVEEIAIASGMPVPAVFVLDNETGINAFAAGWTADNAAIGVTRGALQHLNRRELQGVIAHEFSHIRNGDTRIKTRIIGWVFGIAVITIIGRILLEHLWWAPRRRSSKDDNRVVMAMLAAAIGLIIVGSVGALFARLIQAAVSRQREYLADASAVQYTRDPSGIGEALVKIGGMGRENKIHAAHATEAAHLFFAPSLTSGLATHPPLKQRILRLLPSWDGEFKAPAPLTADADADRESAERGSRWGAALPGQITIPGMPNLGLPVDPVILAAAAGAEQPPPSGAPVDAPPPSGYEAPIFTGPTDAHIEMARGLLARIPDDTQNYLHTRQGAVAAVVGLLVSPDDDLRPKQLEYAAAMIGVSAEYLEAASQVISMLDRPLQLPAIDIALHSIKEMPYEHQLSLAEVIHTLEHSAHHEDLFRWMLRRVLLRHLEDQHDDGSAKHDRSLNELRTEASVVYAVVSLFNSSGPAQAQAAYSAALSVVGIPAGPIPPVDDLPVERVDAALEELSHLDQPGREAFVMGATAAVLFDQQTTADEAELIRVVADAVRLPVPPLLPA